MRSSAPRVRVFAGPNGSGKSTIKLMLRPNLLGTYINPDEIEQQIRKHDFLDLHTYEVQTSEQEVTRFAAHSQAVCGVHPGSGAW
jgi:predicted ABC-type ATPase